MVKQHASSKDSIIGRIIRLGYLPIYLNHWMGNHHIIEIGTKAIVHHKIDTILVGARSAKVNEFFLAAAAILQRIEITNLRTISSRCEIVREIR